MFSFVATRNEAEALRLYQLAAAQGDPSALYAVAECHELGLLGVTADVAEAIRWYRRSQAAGCYDAECKLLWLCKRELT